MKTILTTEATGDRAEKLTTRDTKEKAWNREARAEGAKDAEQAKLQEVQMCLKPVRARLVATPF